VVYPLGPPTLPVLAAVGILIGLAPAWVAPVERRAPATPRARAARPMADGHAEAEAPAADGGSTIPRPTRAAGVPGGRVA
jgi:hypothetical protein